MEVSMTDEFFTPTEAAAFLKRSLGNIYNLVCAGKLKAYKPSGKNLLFKKSELIAWIERGAVSTNDEIAAMAARRS